MNVAICCDTDTTGLMINATYAGVRKCWKRRSTLLNGQTSGHRAYAGGTQSTVPSCKALFPSSLLVAQGSRPHMSQCARVAGGLMADRH